MKYLKIIFLFLVFAAAAYAQLPDTVSVAIDSASSLSAQCDLDGDYLLAIQFPGTVTSDTLFIQTRRSTTGPWIDCYYSRSDGTKTRAYVLVEAGTIVSVHPLMTFYLQRYIRFSGDAEADDRVLSVIKGNY